MNKRSKLAISGVFTIILTMGMASAASAQATRTWVSGVGDDANPCSRTAPCKTFAGAISKTAAGGEINCVDSGGFGGVTITKSLSIICDYVEGGVLVAGTNGITVNAGPADSVYLSGLDLHGANTGLKGVRFIAGGALHIVNSKIRAFAGANGTGISFAPAAASTLFVSNTVITNNGAGAGGGGIEIVPTGSGNSKVVLRNVQIESNANIGLRVDMSGTVGGSVNVVVENTEIAGGPSGVSVTAGGPGAATMMVWRSSILNNFGAGLTANGVNAVVRVSDSTITGNTSGISILGSATVASYGDNRLDGNPATGVPNNGTFTPGTLPKR
jgi:hypothetical protein